MRRFAIIAAVLVVPALAAAQNQGEKKVDQKPDNCFYTVGNQAIQVPLGASVCRRQPAPYDGKYSLLRCNPPLAEIDSDIKREDARCDRYEERQ
ncbi:hypothetical protein QCM80_06100 [Bradyrhizobium sp. SSUT112]|uniref:hypothetical protein n=1 Tax=Bradyrhizobium sp. SSUT112 TaxID=3040604 RepID=UPI002448BB1F|nr:hypothetical protein [Bradyrhizobium sp. SSUT112]MDH2350253.1 hypothetical protein [Bradyrhizobium sp. SSUT112]